MLFSWGVSLCPSVTGLENVNSTLSGVVNVGDDYYILDRYWQQLWMMFISATGLGNEHFLIYVFVLDICCQQLWNLVQLVGCLCALWAQGWRIQCRGLWMSRLVNVGGDYHIFDTYCQKLWNVVQLGVSVCLSGTGFGNERFLRYVFVLDIYCQQLWNVVHLRGCLCALRAQGWGMNSF